MKSIIIWIIVGIVLDRAVLWAWRTEYVKMLRYGTRFSP
jgi:hypothetical protein